MQDLLIIFKSLSGCMQIDQMFKLNKLGLLKNVFDGGAPDYLITKLDLLRFEHEREVANGPSKTAGLAKF